ncbi:hypothetical protein [Actinophytocola glycyrrhizae]|uniref:PPE family protein n=1 Tax=Actinophytocola glycyrrhizae TaxID=2044873 RepID=A0ABV9S238_9PSEU
MFWGYSGREVYDNFHDGRGSDGLIGGAAIVNEVAGSYRERAEQIHRLAARMESAWQGSASGAALRGVGPLLVEHELSGMSLVTAQDLTNRQAGSFGDAKNAVVPVPPRPEPMNPMAMLVSPAAIVDLERQVDDYNTAAQHNVDVMNRYTGASDHNTTNLPSDYGTLTGDQSGISVDPGPTTIDSADFGDSTDSADGSGGPSGGGDRGPGGPGGTGPGPVAGGPSSGGASAPDGGPAGTTPGAGATVPGSFTPTPSSPGSVPGPSPVSPTDPGTGRVPGGLAPVSGLVAGVGPGGEPGAGRGGGVGGQPRGGVAGPRGGVLGGPGVGALAAEEAAARRAAAVAAARGGGPGAMGGAPVGAGRGKGDEDEEHTRKVILEADAESVFGSDVLTAPQVIGDDEYED